jgi:hypothetical protein
LYSRVVDPVERSYCPAPVAVSRTILVGLQFVHDRGGCRQGMRGFRNTSWIDRARALVSYVIAREIAACRKSCRTNCSGNLFLPGVGLLLRVLKKHTLA